jgi:cell division protein FtsQ
MSEMPAANLRIRNALRAAMGLAVAGTLAAALWAGYDALARGPVQQVVFTGDIDRVARADLERLVVAVQGSTAEPAAVRDAAKSLPWVREATVRLRFPNALEVAIEAHVPAARWRDGQLVNTHGEVFSAATDAKLPRLSGPDGSAADMLRTFGDISASLKPASLEIAELKLSARRAWQVVLSSGLVVELGRSELQLRLSRFLSVLPQLEGQVEGYAHADLRYANGIALRRPAGTKRK